MCHLLFVTNGNALSDTKIKWFQIWKRNWNTAICFFSFFFTMFLSNRNFADCKTLLEIGCVCLKLHSGNFTMCLVCSFAFFFSRIMTFVHGAGYIWDIVMVNQHLVARTVRTMHFFLSQDEFIYKHSQWFTHEKKNCAWVGRSGTIYCVHNLHTNRIN